MVELSLRRPNRGSVRATPGRPVGMLIGVATGGVRKRTCAGRKSTVERALGRRPIGDPRGDGRVCLHERLERRLLAAKGSAHCDGRVAFDGRGAMLAPRTPRTRLADLPPTSTSGPDARAVSRGPLRGTIAAARNTSMVRRGAGEAGRRSSYRSLREASRRVPRTIASSPSEGGADAARVVIDRGRDDGGLDDRHLPDVSR